VFARVRGSNGIGHEEDHRVLFHEWGWHLIKPSDPDTVLQYLEWGRDNVVNLADVGTSLTVNVSTSYDHVYGPIVKVEFYFDGVFVRTERGAPFALGGDTSGQFRAFPPIAVPGLHTLCTKIYHLKGGLTSLRLDECFEVEVVSGEPAPVSAPSAAPLPAPYAAPVLAPTSPPTKSPVNLPTQPPVEPSTDYCEQQDSLQYSISIQELQSPAGPRHSDGIVHLSDDGTQAKTLGFVFFSNDIVEPKVGEAKGGNPMGIQTGHCIEVEVDKLLACYFNFNVRSTSKSGRITAEALFDLVNFPAANLVITGGTGDFTGIAGTGCTSNKVPGLEDEFDSTSFIYNFNYDLP